MACSPGPIAGRIRCLAESSPSICSCAIAAAPAPASRHVTARTFSFEPTLIRMNPQITTDAAELPALQSSPAASGRVTMADKRLIHLFGDLIASLHICLGGQEPNSLAGV